MTDSDASLGNRTAQDYEKVADHEIPILKRMTRWALNNDINFHGFDPETGIVTDVDGDEHQWPHLPKHLSQKEGGTRVGHCKADSTDVYAGRGKNGRHMLSVAKPDMRGWLGNPFTMEAHTREESIEQFRIAFVDKLERDDEFRAAVSELSGKTLGCWCQRLDEDEPACHAEVIAGWADLLAEEDDE